MASTASNELNRQAGMLPARKVLIVDDEDYVREILGEMIADLGLEAVQAEDGDRGLAAFEASRADFVACVIDLTMPGMSGLELLARVRKLDSGIPILLVSGYSRHEVRQQEAKSPNLTFLQKPFTPDQFREALNEQLDRS